MQDRSVHNERDRQYHDVIAAEYEKLVNEPRAYINKLLFDPLLSQVRRPVKQVLDLGSGTGQMVFRLHECFQPNSITAVDHSEGMLKSLGEKAKRAGINVDIVHSELIDYITQSSERFDLISCVGVLHHLTKPDVATLLERARGRLSAGGHLLVAEPIENETLDRPSSFIQRWNQKSIASGLQYSVQTEGVQDPDEYPLNEGELVQLLESSGFSLKQQNRIVEIFPHNEPPSFLDRWVIHWVQRHYRNSGFVHAVLAQ